jgi:hypothetical protein
MLINVCIAPKTIDVFEQGKSRFSTENRGRIIVGRSGATASTGSRGEHVSEQVTTSCNFWENVNAVGDFCVWFIRGLAIESTLLPSASLLFAA